MQISVVKARGTPKVVFTATAWDTIGFDHGVFRIKGGRTFYEAVMYNCNNGGNLVKLARLESAGRFIKEVSRYVHPETQLEFLVWDERDENGLRQYIDELPDPKPAFALPFLTAEATS